MNNELLFDMQLHEAAETIYNCSGSVGDMIKHHRLRMGWSQFELAKKLDLTCNQGRYLIKDYETRGIYPTIEISYKLARIFNLDTKYFYDKYFCFSENSIDILNKLRLNLNFTKTEIAKKLSVTLETWLRWEHGGKVSRSNYTKIIKLFK